MIPGQAWVLQDPDIEGKPEQLPDEFSVTRFVRVFVRCPPPQVLEQAFH